MKKYLQHIPLLLLTLFELAAGVLLLANPDWVGKAIIFIFGIVMVIVGGLNLLRFFREKPEGLNGFIVLMVGIVTLLMGVLSLIGTTADLMREGWIVIFYALIFFVLGLYEAQMYFTARKNGRHVSAWLLVSAVTAILFGVLVILNHNGTLVSFLDKHQLPAVFMFCQVVTDAAALYFAVQKQLPPAERTGKKEKLASLTETGAVVPVVKEEKKDEKH